MKKWVACAIAVVLTGCGERSGVLRVVGDTTFIENGAPLRDTASLRELLRIGQSDGAPEYLFTGIGSFAVGPDGQVFIAEFSGDIRLYDHEGQFVRRVARQGAGPGEVDYVVGMAVSDEGHLAVVDFGNQRVSVYSSDGTFLRQVRRPPGRPVYGRDAISWDAAGALWIGLHPPRSGPDTMTTQGRRPIFGRLVGDGAVVDTVFLPRVPSTGCARRHHRHASGFFEDDRLRLLPFIQWSRGAQGDLVVGCSANYGFDIIRESGTVRRVSRSWTPFRMSDDEYDFWMDYSDEVSRERPAFLRIWVADDNRIWAKPATAGHRRDSSPEQRAAGWPSSYWDYWSPLDGLDLFDASGQWIGHVRTPPSWAIPPYPGTGDPQFRGDTVWAVTRDELDVAYLSKFVVDWN